MKRIMSRKITYIIHETNRPVYTIGIAAELVGVHPRTLRIYEEEGLVHPKRLNKKNRLYSQEEIARIRTICELIEKRGLNLAGIRTLLEMAKRFHVEVDQMMRGLLEGF